MAHFTKFTFPLSALSITILSLSVSKLKIKFLYVCHALISNVSGNDESHRIYSFDTY